MMICLPQVALTTTCAWCGIGKLPIGASTLTLGAGLAEADPVCEAAAAGEEGVRVVAGARGRLAAVIPAVHAARDRPAAQVVTATAMRRYAFIGYL